MKDGMYSVSFSSAAQANGSGVAAISNGEIRGGDAGYAYLGRFTSTDDKTLAASLRIVRHNDQHQSVFGPLKDFRLQLKGTADGDRFVLSGGIPDQPKMTITIRGRWFEELKV